MNVLFINTKRKFGGVVGWMTRVVEALEKRGHHCWVVSSKKTEFVKFAPPGISIIEVNSVSDYSPYVILFLYRFIKHKRIDVVFTNTTKEISVGGIAAKLAGIPNIRRVGNYTDLNNTRKNRFLSRHFVTHTVSPCKAILSQAQDAYHWIKADQYTVIYNGRNLKPVVIEASLQIKRSLGIPPNAFVFGMNVQLVPVKGINDAMQAFSSVVMNHPNCYLVICGDGSLKEEINLRRKQMHLEDKILMPGFQKDVIGWSAMYNSGLLASSDEGFPNTIVEYMAAGIPVISSDVGGVSEIVQHEYNGFLFKAGDIQSLTHYMNRMIGEPELRTAMGEHALKTIQERFTEDVMIDKIEELIYDLSSKN